MGIRRLQVGRERSPAAATIVDSGDPDYQRVWMIVNAALRGLPAQDVAADPVVALTRSK